MLICNQFSSDVLDFFLTRGTASYVIKISVPVFLYVLCVLMNLIVFVLCAAIFNLLDTFHNTCAAV